MPGHNTMDALLYAIGVAKGARKYHDQQDQDHPPGIFASSCSRPRHDAGITDPKGRPRRGINHDLRKNLEQDAIKLKHPDRHPRESASRCTQIRGATANRAFALRKGASDRVRWSFETLAALAPQDEVKSFCHTQICPGVRRGAPRRGASRRTDGGAANVLEMCASAGAHAGSMAPLDSRFRGNDDKIADST